MAVLWGFQKGLDGLQPRVSKAPRSPPSLSDKQSNNVRIYNTDPGLVRTPGSRRWITMGCLWGLGIYFVTWPIWGLVSKDK